jgi:pimeloyl-ACP methyl ester carboxylesterase
MELYCFGAPGLKGLAIGAAILAAVLLGSAAGGFWWLTQRVEGSHFDSEGVRIHFTDEGSGTPLVLLHGFAVNADLNWRLPGLTEALAREFRVISMDLRGHGLSGKPHDPELYGDAMAQDVIALLDHLGIEKAHLAGYSLGGIITLKLATTHPDRLLSASPLGAGWENPEDSTFLIALAGIADALESGRGVPPLSASLGGDREPPGFLHTLWVRVMTGCLNDGPALAAMVRGIRGLTVEREALSRISVPVCSIVGTRDPMKAGVDAMVGVVPDHTVVFLEGADHLQAPRTAEFAKALREFLHAHGDGTALSKDAGE